MKNIVKIPGIVILLIISLTVIIRLLLPLAAVKIANRKLPGILNTEASIGSVRLGLLRGYLSIRNIRIAQPEEFGDGEMLLAPEVRARINLASLFRSPLTIEEVTLNDCEINIVRNPDGLKNIDAIQPASPAGSEEPKEEGGDESGAKPILIRRFSINNLSCSYTDHAIALDPEEAEDEAAGETLVETGEKPLETATRETEAGLSGSTATGEETREKGNEPVQEDEGDLQNENMNEEEEVLRVKIAELDLLVTDLLIDPEAVPGPVEPAQLLLTARIIQSPFTDGLLGLEARIGPIGAAGMPSVNAVLRLADLELDPLDVVIPDGVAQVLGGSALDLSIDLALADYLLDCDIEIEVSGGRRIALPIGGTPAKPEIDTSSILFGVMLHFGGGVRNLLGNIGGAGYDVGEVAAGATLAVGEGTANVLGSIGGGLFKTVTGAATGDLDRTVEGLSDASVGAAGQAAAAG